MKTIRTLFLTLAALVSAAAAKAGRTYNITSNSNWSSALPTTCSNCTINISTGKTLTVDESVTCQNCAFSGGTMSMGSYTMSIQYSGSVTTTSFTGVKFQISGSGNVIVNAPLSLTNSTFTFQNTSSMTTSYQVDMVSSIIKLSDNTTMTFNGASSTNINLSNSSEIQIGNGTTTSTASLLVNGPTLNVYDASKVVVANNNNAYNNWASYNAPPNSNASNSSARAYSTSNNNMNCGSGYPNSCANPSLYGPATLAAGGASLGATILPVTLADFSATQNANKTVSLSWDTRMEENSRDFEIERSANGKDWTTIGTIQAKDNSNIQQDYSYTDQEPTSGTDYYRLKLVDLDGKYGYSEVKVIHSSLVGKISLFPNPAHDYVNIALGQASGTDITVRLINQAGQVLQEKKLVGGNGVTVSLPVQQYATGLYILTVAGADGSHESSKLLISRS